VRGAVFDREEHRKWRKFWAEKSSACCAENVVELLSPALEDVIEKSLPGTKGNEAASPS
jgi:hypothetical protein